MFDHDGYVTQRCKNHTTSMTVPFEPDHSYEILAKLTVGTTFTGDVGSALSDFSQKTDGDETVDVGNFDVNL